MTRPVPSIPSLPAARPPPLKKWPCSDPALKPKDKDRIFLADHLDNLDDHLRHCRVSVSLCGYNTSVQLMRYGTPSVIVPYQNNLSQNSTNDQVARARLLHERFSSIILDYDTMTAQSLADAIKEQMSSPDLLLPLVTGLTGLMLLRVLSFKVLQIKFFQKSMVRKTARTMALRRIIRMFLPHAVQILR